jgi:16S rRNA (guanine527-N7)-methyltransferase
VLSGSATPPSDHLVRVLERARSVGFLGPGPVDEHVAHAARFLAALRAGGLEHGRIADIGSGGGVPGLVLLASEPGLEAVLLDAAQKRCSFLVWAAAELGLDDRVEVWCGRAEVIAHEDRARERFDAVVARGFGPPAVTLECATGLVRPGGRVVVSEPPERRIWPAEALAELALVEVVADRVEGVAVFERLPALPGGVPRSGKQLQRAPRFTME